MLINWIEIGYPLSQFWTSPLFHILFCFFLTCIQISQEVGKVVWYSYLFKNFPPFLVIHTVKGFSIVNEAEVDVILEFSCFFYDPMDHRMAIWFLVPLPFLNPAWTKLGKEYVKALYCHPAYLTYMQSTSWETVGWMKHKLESRLPGEKSITSDTQMTPLQLQQKAKRN